MPSSSPAATSSPGAAASGEGAFEPCPVPGDDVPQPDTEVQFDAPPNGGITAGYLFDVEVRFEDDDVFEGIVRTYEVGGFAGLDLVELGGAHGTVFDGHVVLGAGAVVADGQGIIGHGGKPNLRPRRALEKRPRTRIS